jgi:hypothetical protein
MSPLNNKIMHSVVMYFEDIKIISSLIDTLKSCNICEHNYVFKSDTGDMASNVISKTT